MCVVTRASRVFIASSAARRGAVAAASREDRSAWRPEHPRPGNGRTVRWGSKAPTDPAPEDLATLEAEDDLLAVLEAADAAGNRPAAQRPVTKASGGDMTTLAYEAKADVSTKELLSAMVDDGAPASEESQAEPGKYSGPAQPKAMSENNAAQAARAMGLSDQQKRLLEEESELEDQVDDVLAWDADRPGKGVSTGLELEQAAKEMEDMYQPEEDNSIFAKVYESFSWVMVGDVFLILFCSVYVVGAATLQQLKITSVAMDGFMSIWNPVIQPVLGIFMGFRLAGVGWDFVKDRMK